ncbi:MAG: GNAT family N-acetyltransferase [Clostridia bacterium]|nr:GNAT family N-acetyltransferase [Clostridia bacterium]
MNSLTFRPLTTADLPAVMAMQTCIFAHLPNPRWYFGSTEDEFRHDIENHLSIGAFDGDTLAAFALASFGEQAPDISYAAKLGEDPAHTLDYRDVMVGPDYRRRGIQSFFLRHWDEVARQNGCTALYCTVDPENVPSYAAVEKAGYKRVCIKPAYDGRDRIYYKKTLD